MSGSITEQDDVSAAEATDEIPANRGGVDIKLTAQQIADLGSGGGAGGGGSGALVLLESHTASASSSLDFTTRNASGQSGATFQSDFDEYLVEVAGLVPATNGVTFLLRFSTDGGSSYDSGSNYTGAGFRASKAGSAAADIGGTSISLSGGTGGTQVNTATKSFLSSFKIYNPGSTSLHKRVMGNSSGYDGTANPDFTAHITATYASTTAVNAFRVLASSGNIASGTIRVYGVAKS